MLSLDLRRSDRSSSFVVSLGGNFHLSSTHLAHAIYRFFGLFGIYYSVKYLSLSDAVVLSFLVPTTTAVAGFLFLHEKLSRKEVFAGRKSLLRFSSSQSSEMNVSKF